MKRILLSGIIALGFHIAFFAALPMLLQKAPKPAKSEVKSINVTMSYRPLKLTKNIKKEHSFKKRKIKLIKTQFDQKKTLSAIEPEKKIEPQEKVNPTFSKKTNIEKKIPDNKVLNKESLNLQNTEFVNITEPFYKKKPLLKYPLEAKRRGYEGTVELMVQVSEQGQVSNLWIFKSSNYKSLDNQAVKIVKNWIFEPGKKNGKPEMMWVKIPIKFKLE